MNFFPKYIFSGTSRRSRSWFAKSLQESEDSSDTCKLLDKPRPSGKKIFALAKIILVPKNIYLEFGYTVLGLLISLAIIVMMNVIIISAFVNYRYKEALSKDAQTVVEVLGQARSLTLASQSASQYGVRITSSKITLFTGNAYSNGAATNKDFTFDSYDSATTISLTGGGSDVIFQRLSGETTQNGTITLTSSGSSRTRTVTIYKTGLIESN